MSVSRSEELSSSQMYTISRNARLHSHPMIEMIEALQRHWPEYLLEGAELGLFMISACLFADVFGLKSLKPTQSRTLHRPVLWGDGSDIYQPGSAVLGDEHEPGADHHGQCPARG